MEDPSSLCTASTASVVADLREMFGCGVSKTLQVVSIDTAWAKGQASYGSRERTSQLDLQQSYKAAQKP